MRVWGDWWRARKGALPRALLDTYTAGFMEALAVPATRGRHVNVLQHMAGYFDEADAGVAP
jgi:uncharacterized protein YbgA (DUF1722 family)